MIAEIWRSFCRLPLWVQIWVLLWLAPVNALAIVFWSAPLGIAVACLAIGGMIPNLWIMIRERGVSRLMALPHLVFWTPLIALLLWLLLQGQVAGRYQVYLWILLLTDLISLGFDYPDFRRWRGGERDIA